MTDKKEFWKTYPKHQFIEVSNLGNIRTKDHWVTCKNGVKRLVKGKILKQLVNYHGYMYVHFSVNGKDIHLFVHRMVATCFIPNPNGYPEVNHIDNDPTNNVVDNLEWCTPQYNIAYREKYGKSAAKVFGHPVIAVGQETFDVFWFESQHEASRQLEVNVGSVNMVIKGRRNKTGGCWLCNADSTAVEKTRSKFGDEIADKVERLLQEHL